MNTETEKLLLTVDEVCNLTGVCEKTVRKVTAENQLQVKIGRRTLVHKKKFENWLDRRTKCN